MCMQKQLLKIEATVLKENRDRYKGVLRGMKVVVEGSPFISWPFRPK